MAAGSDPAGKPPPDFDDPTRWGGFSTIDGEEVTFDGLVRDTIAKVAAIDAQRAALDAERARVLAHARAEAVDKTLTDARSSDGAINTTLALKRLASEVGIATRRHDQAVGTDIEQATRLTTYLPQVTTALAEGQIGGKHADACLEGLSLLETDEQRIAYDEEILEVAKRHVPSRIKREARAIAARLAAVTVQERCREAVSRRNVWITELGDGLSEFHLTGPSPLIHALHDRVGRMARNQLEHEAAGAEQTADKAANRATGDGQRLGSPSEAPTIADWIDQVYRDLDDHDDHDKRITDGTPAPGDAGERERRTYGQIQSDLATELLLGADPAELARRDQQIQAHVTLTMPALALAPDAALLAGDDDPAIAANAAATAHDPQGPIDLDTARRIAGDATELVRLLTHPVEGHVVAVDARTPTAGMRRFLRARDAGCRYPGCNLPATRCDADHTIARDDGGPTALTNLSHLCKRHHMLKHSPGYGLTQHDDGTLEWRTPAGQTVTTTPSTVHIPGSIARVFFRPADLNSSWPPARDEPPGKSSLQPIIVKPVDPHQPPPF